MFRAVFETAVERAEENPGLVDSEDINTTLHPPPSVAGIFYLLLGRSALPPSSSSSNSYGQRVYKSRWTRESSKTLTKNIKNQFGSKSYFDAVLVYFNNNQGDGVIIIKGRDLQE
ncbi:hypothetical protein BY996DRAFT_6454828 [Phakopsora pachyrhizi]|nr:hypothetical protein BY996DRAFT_6454828 [Phakopsora pachyrhizi]